MTGAQTPISMGQALERAREIISKSKGIVGIGSPRASLEANFSLRTLVGPGLLFRGYTPKGDGPCQSGHRDLKQGFCSFLVSRKDRIIGRRTRPWGGSRQLSANGSTRGLLEDLRNEPMAIAEKLHIPACDDRAVRVAVQDRHGPLYIATPMGTWLDRFATKAERTSPQASIARLPFAAAHHIDAASPGVSDFNEEALALVIAGKLKEAKQPLIIYGISSGNEKVVRAAANVAWALAGENMDARISFVLRNATALDWASCLPRASSLPSRQ